MIFERDQFAISHKTWNENQKGERGKYLFPNQIRRSVQSSFEIQIESSIAHAKDARFSFCTAAAAAGEIELLRVYSACSVQVFDPRMLM